MDYYHNNVQFRRYQRLLMGSCWTEIVGKMYLSYLHRFNPSNSYIEDIMEELAISTVLYNLHNIRDKILLYGFRWSLFGFWCSLPRVKARIVWWNMYLNKQGGLHIEYITDLMFTNNKLYFKIFFAIFWGHITSCPGHMWPMA